MPGYRVHLAGAGVTYFVLMFVVLRCIQPPLFSCFMWFLCCLAGGLFPDIDTKSYGQKIFYKLLMLMFLILYFTKQWSILGVLSLCSVVPLCVNHRGLFHNVWFIIALSGLGAVLLTRAYVSDDILVYGSMIFFMCGAISHLYLDLGFSKMFRWRI